MTLLPCTAMHAIQYRKHRVTLLTRRTLKIDVNKMFAHGNSAAEETRAQRGGHCLREKGEGSQLQRKNIKGGMEGEGSLGKPDSPDTHQDLRGRVSQHDSCVFVPRQLQYLYWNNAASDGDLSRLITILHFFQVQVQ